MIYIDSSVVLAHVLVEDRIPPADLWTDTLIASRLLEYEVWTRIHARRLGQSHGDSARAALGRVSLIELAPAVLARVLEPFPAPVRTLDAIHLASMAFVRDQGQAIELATYDERLARAARALAIPIRPL